MSHRDQSKTDVHVLLLQGICCFVDLGENACSILVGNRFEEPLANLLNERHRTVKELLEQLKMKKPSVRQQPEVEKLKPQEEAAHQTLVLDPAQRSRLQQQMQQARLLSVCICIISWLSTEARSEQCGKVRGGCPTSCWNRGP